MEIALPGGGTFPLECPVYTLPNDAGVVEPLGFPFPEGGAGPTVAVFTDEDLAARVAADGLRPYRVETEEELRTIVRHYRATFGVRRVAIDVGTQPGIPGGLIVPADAVLDAG